MRALRCSTIGFDDRCHCWTLADDPWWSFVWKPAPQPCCRGIKAKTTHDRALDPPQYISKILSTKLPSSDFVELLLLISINSISFQTIRRLSLNRLLQPLPQSEARYESPRKQYLPCQAQPEQLGRLRSRTADSILLVRRRVD